MSFRISLTGVIEIWLTGVQELPLTLLTLITHYSTVHKISYISADIMAEKYNNV